MTLGTLIRSLQDLFKEATNIDEENDLRKAEVYVYFDFPIDGRMKKYRVAKVDNNGIMLYNDEVNRPKGHAIPPAAKMTNDLPKTLGIVNDSLCIIQSSIEMLRNPKLEESLKLQLLHHMTVAADNIDRINQELSIALEPTIKKQLAFRRQRCQSLQLISK